MNNIKLNEALIVEKQVSMETQLAIKATHVVLDRILDNPELLGAQGTLEAVQGLEYSLQKLWGFPQDPGYHRFEFKIKGCSCPEMDNFDMWATGMKHRYYNMNCVIHG